MLSLFIAGGVILYALLGTAIFITIYGYEKARFEKHGPRYAGYWNAQDSKEFSWEEHLDSDHKSAAVLSSIFWPIAVIILTATSTNDYVVKPTARGTIVKWFMGLGARIFHRNNRQHEDRKLRDKITQEILEDAERYAKEKAAKIDLGEGVDMTIVQDKLREQYIEKADITERIRAHSS